MVCIKETSTNGQSGPDGIHDQEFDGIFHRGCQQYLGHVIRNIFNI